MNPVPPKSTTSGLDVAAYLFSLVSIACSVAVGMWLLDSKDSGLHGSTAILIALVLGCQVAGFGLTAVTLLVIQGVRGRVCMSRAAAITMGTTLLAVIAEGIAFAFIPVTGNC